MTIPNIFSGTSGLVLPIAKINYPQEYQDKSRLSYYASLFNSIEINSSFYKMPMVSTVKKWAESVPDHFKFTFKLSKLITHGKGLLYDPAEVIKFMHTISHADNKKGCVLIQFPGGTHAQIHKLEALLIHIRSADEHAEWNLAIEFRHNSWYMENTYRLLEQFSAALVIHDIPKSATPQDDYESDVIYLRFHGPGGRYRGSYTDDFLHEYAGYIHNSAIEGKEVYIYFNNTMGDAVKNLITLNERIKTLVSSDPV